MPGVEDAKVVTADVAWAVLGTVCYMGFSGKKKVSWTLVVEKLMFRSFGPCLFRLLHYRLLHIITI
jgi:hypothetical protein